MKYNLWILDGRDYPYESQPEIIETINRADRLVSFKTNGKHSLKEDLNTMQSEHLLALSIGNEASEDTTLFKNKFTIPLYFINLILHKYGLKIEQEDDGE